MSGRQTTPRKRRKSTPSNFQGTNELTIQPSSLDSYLEQLFTIFGRAKGVFAMRHPFKSSQIDLNGHVDAQIARGHFVTYSSFTRSNQVWVNRFDVRAVSLPLENAHHPKLNRHRCKISQVIGFHILRRK